jgi:outer membrane protein
MINRISAIFLLQMFVLAPAFGQKSWSLKDCIDHALKNNITIKQTEIASEISSVNYTQSKATLFPSLNASGSYSYNFGRSVDPFTNDFTNQEIQSANVSLNSSVTLFNGFQLQNSLRQSKYEYLAGKEDLQKIKNDISLNVAAAYLQVLYGKEAVKLSQDRLDAALETRNRSKILVDAGSLAQGNLLDAEAALAAEQLNLVNVQNSLKTAIISLTQLLELKADTSFNVEDPLMEIPAQGAVAMSADEIYNTALTVLPEIKAGTYKVTSAEKGLSISRGARFPRLTLFGSLSSGYSNASLQFTNPVFLGFQENGQVTSSGDLVLGPVYEYNSEKVPFNDQLDQNFNKSVGISISIPIFNGWSTESNIKRSRLSLENAKYSDQLLRNQLYKSVVQAHADASAALARYDAAEKSSTANSEAYSYAEKKFNVGLLSSFEFLNATNNKAKADSDFLQARYDLIFRIKVLDFYLGKPLYF